MNASDLEISDDQVFQVEINGPVSVNAMVRGSTKHAISNQTHLAASRIIRAKVRGSLSSQKGLVAQLNDAEKPLPKRVPPALAKRVASQIDDNVFGLDRDGREESELVRGDG